MVGDTQKKRGRATFKSTVDSMNSNMNNWFKEIKQMDKDNFEKQKELERELDKNAEARLDKMLNFFKQSQSFHQYRGMSHQNMYADAHSRIFHTIHKR